MRQPKIPIPLEISRQPDDSTCGPTALQSVYKHLGYDLTISEIMQNIRSFEDGGTLGVALGLHALMHGFHAELVSYNLRIFDPTWSSLTSEALIDKLQGQIELKEGKKFKVASEEYISFLKAGGKIIFEDLSVNLLDAYFKRKLPVLVGLSATYLYRAKREFAKDASSMVEDDLKGEPVGHFVVLCGRKGDQVFIADPYKDNPMDEGQYYQVELNHLFHSILLGIVTYDANLLAIWPAEQ